MVIPPGRDPGPPVPALPPVDVVLPCLDEAAALPRVLSGLPDGWRAIVVDNGSRDGSAEIAGRLGATVVHEPRRGFGAACAAGLAAATAPVVGFSDADGSLDLADLVPLVAAVRGAGSPVLAVGRRRVTSATAWPLHARLGNAVLAARLRRRSGVPLRDLGPLRAAPRQPLVDLDLRDRRFGYPLEMVLRAASAGWRVVEHDVAYRPRVGRSKVTGTVRGTLAAVRDLRRVLADQAPAGGPAGVRR